MEFNIKDLGEGIAVLHLNGRLNMVTATKLRELVTSTVAQGHTRIAIDLSKVQSIDSSGLGALISGLKTARQAGGDLRIASPNEQVKLVLQLTNMDKVLTAYDNAESAFSSD